ncbi:RagB/SusD family nutrient uptake outer membrane protein [Candidatus Saccharibacteria bacterium]|nr:RagB/SusD family nutrient uptake outer membrane protein [Candidatus Saccharibacteria bacterium]
MMKNILIKFILGFGLMAFLGCNDAIDIEQPGRLGAENAFLSIDDLNGGLLAAYNNLDTTYEIGLTAVLTDESYRGIQNGGQNLEFLNFNLNSSSSYVGSIWASNYGAIDMVNRILAAAENIDREDNPEYYDNILGQAYAIRAYSFFKILTFFSTDYTDDNALAGILRTTPTTPDEIFSSVPRNTNAEFYTQIDLDLNAAENLINQDLGNKFVNLDFIKALRARMAAYRGQYALADGYAAELLADYPIADQNQYMSMFADADDTEIIFALERTINDSYDGQGSAGGGWAGSLFAFSNPNASGGPFMEVSRSVFNILDGTNDIRLNRNVNLAESSIDPDYETNNNFLNDDVLLVFKYPGSESKFLMNDLKVFRSSEMLLIRAEAAADANQLGQVATFIKQLRDARYGSSQALPSYANQQEAFGAILDERRLEFLFEGQRWVDLKRLGNKGNRSIDRDPRECSFFSCSIDNDDFRFTLPIPISEVIANSEVEQNPGY